MIFLFLTSFHFYFLPSIAIIKSKSLRSAIRVQQYPSIYWSFVIFYDQQQEKIIIYQFFLLGYQQNHETYTYKKITNHLYTIPASIKYDYQKTVTYTRTIFSSFWINIIIISKLSKQMGQCQVCTNTLDPNFNSINSDHLFAELGTTQLGKSIEKLRKDNQQYIQQYKIVTNPDCTHYKGKLQNGLKVGYGQLYTEQFNYFGFFKNDLPDGLGAIITQSQCQYGQFTNGALNGQGTEWNQKYSFQGSYKNGQRVKGKLMRDELTYTGQLNNDHYHGIGVLNLKDQTNYEGGFAHGKFQGKGKLTFSNGNVYTGKFKNGKYDGYGEFIWANGNSYKGQYENGEKHGYGILRIDRLEYSGYWKNGIREGRGFFFQGSQQVFGDWKENLLIQN